ncbi:uncharacterized protein [Prorops nasuta]|uniref:uncharacterized protein n=1 Tax=Prorops nasuta TaxID=863751 RepID=UPI0034CD57C3
MKYLIFIALVGSVLAAPERERRSLGWGHNGAVILGGWGHGVAITGPVGHGGAAVIGPVSPSVAVVGPTAGSAAVIGPSDGPTVVAGSSGTIVAPGAVSALHGLWGHGVW